ncbi:hypothetical protein MOQ72_00350 [Saccharopolyspora sp. K220]|uniref:hypothetical protein n=1 Tax=Saccharopolyspora soli TaxID=2926618 RepID=UPI001F595C99|nr:hypothetical protein [Saccharopolyspora soli]MCI2415860.1 hypothetical protein [Saccharopolyspora soli]
MTFFSVDAEPGVESELIDLEMVPLSELRTLNHAALYRSLRHVVERAADIGVTESGTNDGKERAD